MGKDYPDWGSYTGEFKAGTVRDLAELAVRLGSPVCLSGSGRWIFYEDFSKGLGRWQLSSTGAGQDPYLTAAHWLYGGFSAVLDSGAVSDDQSEMAVTLAAYPDSPLGVQFGVSFTDSLVYLDVYANNIRGGQAALYQFRFDPYAELIQALDADGNFYDLLTDAEIQISSDVFHVVKFTLNAAAQQYGFFQFDNTVISDIPYSPSVYATGDKWQTQVGFISVSRGGTGTEIYIDHAIISYDEAL